MNPALDMNTWVYLEWIDSTVLEGPWSTTDYAKSLAEDHQLCVSVGLVLEESKELLVIASTISGNQVGGVISIPRVAIQRKQRLEVPEIGLWGPGGIEVPRELEGIEEL